MLWGPVMLMMLYGRMIPKQEAQRRKDAISKAEKGAADESPEQRRDGGESGQGVDLHPDEPAGDR